MLTANYRIRLVAPLDFDAIIEICRLVYPAETPYTFDELEDHSGQRRLGRGHPMGEPRLPSTPRIRIALPRSSGHAS